MQQILDRLIPGSHMKCSWYFHRTQDLFLCYSHRNCSQLYWPVENTIKLCLGVRQMVYITPVKRLAHPLLFENLVTPRLSGWVFFSVSSLPKFPLVLKALHSGILLPCRLYREKTSLFSNDKRAVPRSFLFPDLSNPFSLSLQDGSFILTIALTFLFCICFCLNMGS